MRTNGYKRSAQLSKSLDFIDPEVFKSLAVQDESLFTTDDDSGDEDAQGGRIPARRRGARVRRPTLMADAHRRDSVSATILAEGELVVVDASGRQHNAHWYAMRSAGRNRTAVRIQTGPREVPLWDFPDGTSPAGRWPRI